MSRQACQHNLEVVNVAYGLGLPHFFLRVYLLLSPQIWNDESVIRLYIAVPFRRYACLRCCVMFEMPGITNDKGVKEGLWGHPFAEGMPSVKIL